MKKEKVWFNWHCPHCRHRNRVTFPFQFELPQHYSAEWTCDECGETSKLEFNFTVSSWLNNKKTPKLRKRKQEEKKRRKEKTKTEDENDGYKNGHGDHKI